MDAVAKVLAGLRARPCVCDLKHDREACWKDPSDPSATRIDLYALIVACQEKCGCIALVNFLDSRAEWPALLDFARDKSGVSQSNSTSRLFHATYCSQGCDSLDHYES